MNRGNYYKLRSKRWFIDKGYQCDYVEKLQRIYVKGRIIYVKKDLFGADLLAFRREPEEFILANSVYNRKNIASHIKVFKEYPFPGFIKLWILVWEFRAREPEIVEV